MTKTIIAICLVIFLMGVMVGARLCYVYIPRTVIETQMQEVPVIQEKVITKTLTEVQYVTKTIDPKTGEKEKTDVEAVIKQPTVNVLVNGKEQEFKLQQGETQKFENGKIVLNQESTLRLDIKINDPKLLKIDAFVGKGYGVTVKYKKLSIDADLSDLQHIRIDRVRYEVLGL